jgi:hypothetical protein
MHGKPTNTRELLRWLHDHDCTVEKTRGGHYRAFYQGRQVGSFASTPSSPTSIINAFTDIRRALRLMQAAPADTDTPATSTGAAP